MKSLLLLAAREAAMKSVLMLSAATLLGQPVLSQTVYKCPPASPGGPPIFQQVPCQLGGERVQVRVVHMGDSGLRDSERAWLDAQDRYRQQQAAQAAEEAREERRIAAEHHKARAAEEQAEAQRETAEAIWSLRRH